MKYESACSASSKQGDCCTLKVSSSFGSRHSVDGVVVLDSERGDGDDIEFDVRREPEEILERISIFSSFSSSKSFSSLTSASSALTLSSNDSV